MASSAKEKFDAAVKVIHSLPKNGPFQASNQMKLHFYALYKQATQGKCNVPRPSFWDIIGKYKWDAWNALGDMSQEEAMIKYVEGMKQGIKDAKNRPEMKIVEAMPHNDTVLQFIEKLDNFYELIDDDELKQHKEMVESNIKRRNEAQEKPTLNGLANREFSETFNDLEQSLANLSHSQESYSSLESSELSRSSVSRTETLEHSYSIPVKALPRQTDDNTPTQNGRINGFGYENGSMESDSEPEEFCDTSDLLLNVPNEMVGKTSKPSKRLANDEDDTDAVPFRWEAESIQDCSIQNSSIIDSGFVDGDAHHDANGVAARGGGEMTSDSGNVNLRRLPSHVNPPGSSRGPGREGDQSGQGDTELAGGAGGGDRSPNYDFTPRSEVTEQIALALVRLQQDMNSVLSRLQTLEALSLAQHQISRSRTNSEGDRQEQKFWWWPFGNLSGKTVVTILVWPVIVHWFLTLLARRRNRLRRS